MVTVTCQGPGCSVQFEAKRLTARYHADACKKAAQREEQRIEKVFKPRTEIIVTSQVLGEPTEESLVPEDRFMDIKAEDEPVVVLEEGYMPGGVIPMIAPDIEGMRLPPMQKPVKARKKIVAASPSKLKQVEQQVAESMSFDKNSYIDKMNERLRAKGLGLISKEPEVIRFVPSGVPAIDALTVNHDYVDKVGGFPRKRITEIFGPKGVGKTSLVKYIIDANPDLRIMFIDAEGGLMSPPEQVIVLQETDIESIEATVFDAIRNKEVDLVIIDSLAALTTMKELDDGKENMGGIAKSISRFIRRTNAILRPLDKEGYPSKELGTAIVFINQLRKSFNQYGPNEYTLGGASLEYAASLRLDLRSGAADKIQKNAMIIGQRVKVTVKKSRFGPSGDTTSYKIMYDKFIDADENYKKRIEELLG